MAKSLPTSIATFQDIIHGDFLYIDKTDYVYQFAQKLNAAYFLSRPRRVSSL